MSLSVQFFRCTLFSLFFTSTLLDSSFNVSTKRMSQISISTCFLLLVLKTGFIWREIFPKKYVEQIRDEMINKCRMTSAVVYYWRFKTIREIFSRKIFDLEIEQPITYNAYIFLFTITYEITLPITDDDICARLLAATINNRTPSENNIQYPGEILLSMEGHNLVIHPRRNNRLIPVSDSVSNNDGRTPQNLI